MPKFQIWDSEDDVDALDNEEFTPICYVKKSSIVPNSFSPNSNEVVVKQKVSFILHFI